MICDNFYLTGGTALAEFYLHHRLSEDLDFFSEQDVDVQAVSIFLAKVKKSAKITKVEHQQSFNRNLFFLNLLDGDTIKTEFTFFPFTRIEKKEKIGDLFIDSIIDIAVNKVFTIYQKPRCRDFMDLYCILEKYTELSLTDLVCKAQIKFDNFFDPIQLGSQYMKVLELKDMPKMLINIKDTIWQDFFLAEAKKLSTKIIK